MATANREWMDEAGSKKRPQALSLCSPPGEKLIV
jgi:hypothetical protein